MAAPLRLALICIAVGATAFGCSVKEIHKTSGPRPLPSHRSAVPPGQVPGYPKPYKVLGRWYQPLASARGFRQEGIASWYGEAFHGRPTSNGETYNMYGVSAAHKTLPLGTFVRVFNLRNQRILDVRINDRGPFVPGRVIDLSYGAAVKLGLIGPGTAPVRVVALGEPAGYTGNGRPAAYDPVDFYRGEFSIQVGAFQERANAEALLRDLERSYKNTHIRSEYGRHDDRLWHRVMVGHCTDLLEAEKYENILRRRGFYDAFAVATR